MTTLPENVSYLSNWLKSPDQLMLQMLKEPWRKDQIRGRPIPRLQQWYGDKPYTYSGITMQPLPWPKFLETLRSKINHDLGTNFNSVLANYYRNGMDGVFWHADNEPELGSNPMVASLSLGATRTFHMRSRKKQVQIQLESGSLLFMGSGIQQQWQHAILYEPAIKEPRINLTFREVF